MTQIVMHQEAIVKDRKPKTPKAITLRNLPESVARAVRERAARYHISLNKAVLGLLEDATGVAATGPRRFHDMDHLFGSISPETADVLEREMLDGRRIDPEDWK
jgi:hypothetical protein